MAKTVTCAAAVAVLLASCGGSPRAAAPTEPESPAPVTTPAAPAPAAPVAPAGPAPEASATPAPAAAPAPPAAAGGDDLTPFAKAAIAGGSLLAEGRDGCGYIRQAAQLRHTATGQMDTAAGAGDSMAREILQTHGPRCGVQ